MKRYDVIVIGAGPAGLAAAISAKREGVMDLAVLEREDEQGGILKKEAPLYASKVMRVCPKCDKPTRLAHKIHQDGKKVRVCKQCGAEI